jgi:serine/threonine protein kinase
MKSDYIKKVDHFLLTQELGRGVYGVVYKGVHESTGKEVAVKMIPKAKLDKRNLEYLEREAETLQKIKSKYIIELSELLKTDKNYYMVLDYCDCGDLDKFRKENGGRLEERVARRYIKHVIKGLKAIHDNGIIHRDIKLPNILLKKQPNGKIIAKLGDFGFAKQIKDNINDDTGMSAITISSSFVGTPLNMAPEIMHKKDYNYKTDIWSLGVITYQLLVGTYPFMSHKRDELKDLIDNAKYSIHTSLNISPYAIDFIDRCLKYDPQQRMGIAQVLGHSFVTATIEQLTSKLIREDWLNKNFPKQAELILNTCAKTN